MPHDLKCFNYTDMIESQIESIWEKVIKTEQLQIIKANN